MYHFLFSFPRAKAAPRQVFECVTVMVTMALRKTPLVLARACAPHTPATSSIISQWQSLQADLLPRTSPSQTMWNARLSPTFCPLSGRTKSQPCVGDRICLADALMEDVWLCYEFNLRVFSGKGLRGWAHRCFFQRLVSVEKSWEKEGSQVHVLEAHWVWAAPHCPPNKTTAFTRPLLSLCEWNTKNKRGGCFFPLAGISQFCWHILFTTDSLPHTECTRVTAPMKGSVISQRILMMIFPFYVDDSEAGLKHQMMFGLWECVDRNWRTGLRRGSTGGFASIYRSRVSIEGQSVRCTAVPALLQSRAAFLCCLQATTVSAEDQLWF